MKTNIYIYIYISYVYPCWPRMAGRFGGPLLPQPAQGLHLPGARARGGHYILVYGVCYTLCVILYCLCVICYIILCCLYVIYYIILHYVILCYIIVYHSIFQGAAKVEGAASVRRHMFESFACGPSLRLLVETLVNSPSIRGEHRGAFSSKEGAIARLAGGAGRPARG